MSLLQRGTRIKASTLSCFSPLSQDLPTSTVYFHKMYQREPFGDDSASTADSTASSTAGPDTLCLTPTTQSRAHSIDGDHDTSTSVMSELFATLAAHPLSPEDELLARLALFDSRASVLCEFLPSQASDGSITQSGMSPSHLELQYRIQTRKDVKSILPGAKAILGFSSKHSSDASLGLNAAQMAIIDRAKVSMQMSEDVLEAEKEYEKWEKMTPRDRLAEMFDAFC